MPGGASGVVGRRGAFLCGVRADTRAKTREDANMTLVILNPNAHGGRAVELWNRVVRYVPGAVMADGAPAAIAHAIALGERTFIAAGGDGTVNALLNAMVEVKGTLPLDAFTLGAVGLGSSNDFHKPFARVENGIPLKVDDARTTLRDVGLVRSESGARHFLIGASFGAAATGNALFNAGTGLTGWLKPRWTGGAIACAAMRAIAGHRNLHPAGLPSFAGRGRRWPFRGEPLRCDRASGPRSRALQPAARALQRDRELHVVARAGGEL